MYTSQIDLPADNRAALARLLNTHLAHAIDLELRAKQAHWNVKGPRFIALHELFDKLTAVAAAAKDSLAERAVQLGGIASGLAADVAKASTLKPYPAQAVNEDEHLAALAGSVAGWGRLVRQGIDETAKLGDAGSSDLLTGLVQELDKHLWFLEAHLMGR